LEWVHKGGCARALMQLCGGKVEAAAVPLQPEHPHC
jgi:hypothetical protein